MKKVTLILQTLLGVLLIVFGANKFLDFMPAFEFANPEAGKLMGALVNSYIMPLVGIIEVVVGVLLLVRKSVPFALILLAPISVNIVLFHAILDPANILPALIVALLNSFLIYKNWSSFNKLF